MEAFLAQATVKDKNLQNIIRTVEKQDFGELKRVNKYYYNIRRDRAISPTKHKDNEKLEVFHCRLKALGAQRTLGTAEDDLIKDLFIALMNNTEIQSELLTKTRTPSQVLKYAMNKKRGQENQRAIEGRLQGTLFCIIKFPMSFPINTSSISDALRHNNAHTHNSNKDLHNNKGHQDKAIHADDAERRSH